MTSQILDMTLVHILNFALLYDKLSVSLFVQLQKGGGGEFSVDKNYYHLSTSRIQLLH